SEDNERSIFALENFLESVIHLRIWSFQNRGLSQVLDNKYSAIV
ncbi:1233_t:CDS:1, partial [Paraglomus occultum]